MPGASFQNASYRTDETREGEIGSAACPHYSPTVRRWVGLGNWCGNGVTDPGEDCDDANARDDDACLATCRRARCGDGQVRAHVEECDGTPGCSASCLSCRQGDAAFVWPENGHCYARHDRRLDWETARQTCADGGGALVRYALLAADMAIADALLRDTTDGYWIGLRKGELDSEFTWIGSAPWPQNVRAWWATQAKAPSGCAHVEWAPHVAQGGYAKRTRWPTSVDCAGPRGFVCEQEPWHVFEGNGHAYQIFNQLVFHDDAVKVCAAAGGHLATLATKDEHQFVTTFADVEAWLGATRPTHGSRFAWTTGEPFAFHAFAPGEPDQKESDCLALDRDDLWHDRPCHKRPFQVLCEVD